MAPSAVNGTYSPLPDKPNAAYTWENVLGRPTWATSGFGWANIGPYMDPPVASNDDITAMNSITPVPGNTGYNLGQDQLRWLYVYATRVKDTECIFFGISTTVVSGNYSRCSAGRRGSRTSPRTSPSAASRAPHTASCR